MTELPKGIAPSLEDPKPDRLLDGWENQGLPADDRNGNA